MLVPLDALFEAGPPRVATPGYRRGYERIYGKKRAKAAKKEKEVADKRTQKQGKQAKERAEKTKKDAEKRAADRKAKAAERQAVLKAKKKPTPPPGLNQIPAQIAHCMMAVHTKRGKSKEAAWNICRWAMTKYGYLKGPYRRNTKLPKAIKQTPKGTRRSFQHGMEKRPLGGGLPGTGISKYNRFIKMFKDVEPKFTPQVKQ
jgi:hypothetical protein